MSPTAPSSFQEINAEWPIDRARALVRAATRLLLAASLVAVASVLRIDWRMLWLTERFTCFILGVLVALTLVGAMTLAYSGIRWLLLALWTAPTQVRLSPDGIALHAGPFGRRDVPWSTIQVRFSEGLDVDFLDQLPDDSLLPQLVDRATGMDLAAEILKFARVSPEELSRVVRPLLSAPPRAPVC